MKIDNLQQRAKTLSFHPLFVLVVSLSAALLFAGFAIWRYEGAWRDLLLYYFAPIGIPFIAYLFDRAERWREIIWFIDIPIVILALLRSAYPIPIVSGHSLFLTYAIFTTPSWVTRITAILVLIEVIYLKTFVWHDPTLIGGIVVGALMAWITHRISRRFGLKTRTESY